MLKEKFSKIKVSSRTYKHYIKFQECNVGDMIKIKTINAHNTFKVTAICDICGHEKIMSIGNYRKNYYNKGLNKYACCQSCAYKKYGQENFTKNWDGQQMVKTRTKTWKNKYGYEHNSQVPEIKKLMTKNREETLLKKYGVKYALQIPSAWAKYMKSTKIRTYKYKDINYQGTYELDFLEKYYDKIKIERAKTIRYTFNNEQRVYYPDFYIPSLNLIVEIKSTYFYNAYLDKNLAKQNACKEQGFNFIFIIEKNYSTFEKLLN